jgi:hypothetical protein
MARRSRSTLALVALLAATLAALVVWFTWFAGGAAEPSATARSASGGLERRDTRRDDLAAASSHNTGRVVETAPTSVESPPASHTAVDSKTTTEVRPHDVFGSIEGTLTCAGVPAADWVVVARFCPPGGERITALTDRHGRFVMPDLLAARYTLTVEGPREPATSALTPWLRPLQRTLVDVAMGGVAHVDIELGGGTTVIRGRVVDQFGAAAAGMRVRLRGREAGAAYEFVDVGPRESFDRRRLNVTSLRGDLVDEDSDPCNLSAVFVDVTTTVDESGNFAFEGLPPRLYHVEAIEPLERSVERLGEFLSEFTPDGRSGRYCDTSLLADWDVGDFFVVRRIPFELIVHFVDTAGVAIDRDHPSAKAWCIASTRNARFGFPVRDGPQRIQFVNEMWYGLEDASCEYTVEVSLSEVVIASTSFHLSDVLKTPLVGGRRVHQLTLTLP